MSTFQEYRIRDFLRKDKSGVLTLKEVRRLSEEIMEAAALQPKHNFLLDLRHTTIEDRSQEQVLEMAAELGLFTGKVKSKVASLIPPDGNRIHLAKILERCLRADGLNYKFFTDYEKAIEWLAVKKDPE